MKRFKITVNGTAYEVEVEEIGSSSGNGAVSNSKNNPQSANADSSFPKEPSNSMPKTVTSAASGSVSVTAPMPGNIVSVNVSVGDVVSEGDVLCVLEAMKMENEITAPSGGTVASVNVAAGAAVNGGDLLVSIG